MCGLTAQHYTARYAALAGIFLMCAAPAAACPMCKDAITSGTAAGGAGVSNIATGFFYSILTMVATPLVLMGGLTLAFIWERAAALRRTRHAFSIRNQP